MSTADQSTQEPEVHKGLAGVVADVTAVSKVNPESNSLLYRGYPVQELAASRTIEEVALLLWNGELPTAQELTEFEEFERAHRDLSAELKAVIDALPTDCHPMDCLLYTSPSPRDLSTSRMPSSA